MIYGQLRTLFSLLIVLGLAAGFLWGGFHVLGTVTGSAAPPVATATPTAVTEAPTIVPTAPSKTKTRKPSGVAVKHATPRPAKSPTPRPSPTPQGPPKVIVALSPTDTKGATSFSVSALTTYGLPKLYCQVRNSALPENQSVALTYTWSKDVPNGFLYNYSIPRAAGDYTSGYFQSPVLENPGKFRCDVTIFGKPFGSAHFTVTP